MKSSVLTLVIASSLVSGCVVTANDHALISKERFNDRDRQLVIAHRGASGYLPEHTLAAKAMAYAQGAHYIEQDLVITKDDEIVVLHDHLLDTVTNVGDVFPDRARSDGHFYVVDFSLAEIRKLAVTERFNIRGNDKTAVYDRRFPLDQSSFQINTFAEEIELIQGLNKSTGRQVGIYPEIKSPAFHRSEGKDISAAVLHTLKKYGYVAKQDLVFLQCFDPGELQRIHQELLPKNEMAVRLVQLLGTSAEYRPLLTEQGMARIAEFADGIGPSMNLIINPDSTSANLNISKLVDYAHAQGLVVHPYTFRRDQLPSYVDDFGQLLEIYLDDVGVDGLFTDFPDLAAEYIETRP